MPGIAHLEKDPATGRLVKIPDPNGHLAYCVDLDPDCIGIPCQCWCCAPNAYKITISGGTGPNIPYNGIHILVGGAGVYTIILAPGTITLDFTVAPTIECKNYTLTIGAVGSDAGVVGVADPPSGPYSSSCNGSGTIDELSYDFCPVDYNTTLSPIEVTFAGVTACPGCVETIVGHSLSDIVFISVNGTFSLPKSNCSWLLQEAVGRVDYDQWVGPECDSPFSGGASPLWVVRVTLSGTSPNFSINVTAGGNPVDKLLSGFTFDGTKVLAIGTDKCDTTVVSNGLLCSDPGANIGFGGTATINWNP